jgi:hypothetical protein
MRYPVEEKIKTYREERKNTVSVPEWYDADILAFEAILRTFVVCECAKKSPEKFIFCLDCSGSL